MAGERRLLASLLKLLPPRPGPDKSLKDRCTNKGIPTFFRNFCYKLPKKDVTPVVSLQGTYLPSCSSALRYAAGAVRVFVLLEIHEGVSLPLDVRLVDVIQGLQAFSSHGCVPSVQGG